MCETITHGAVSVNENLWQCHRWLLALPEATEKRQPWRMEIVEFAEITRRVRRRNAGDLFRPTLCIPEKTHLVVLEGAPAVSVEELRPIVLAWARDKAGPTAEFLVAWPEKDGFRIGRRADGKLEEQVFHWDASLQ